MLRYALLLIILCLIYCNFAGDFIIRVYRLHKHGILILTRFYPTLYTATWFIIQGVVTWSVLCFNSRRKFTYWRLKSKDSLRRVGRRFETSYCLRSSGSSLACLTLKMKVIQIFETSVTIYQSVRQNNSEDLNVQMCQPQFQSGSLSVT